MSDGAEIGYADALGELDTILRELEGDDVDVDRLVDRVERAQFLIGLCRDRLSQAQMRVRDILGDDDQSRSEP
jgi:exodeoxyribonuclease VII small subunit